MNSSAHTYNHHTIKIRLEVYFTFRNASKPDTSTVFSAVLRMTSCIFLLAGFEAHGPPAGRRGKEKDVRPSCKTWVRECVMRINSWD